jgi:2,3-bisphosphoglycerate-independent phosphoglycerate mutase
VGSPPRSASTSRSRRATSRINFATLDDEGKVRDRRAGRSSTETSRALCEKLRESIDLDLDSRDFSRP